MLKRIVIVVLCLLASVGARAQFVLGNGEERSSRKWNYIETETYKVIYPQGLDSLARVYARELELGVEPVSYSAGYKINSSYKKKWPVVLHSYNALSNGFVAYPPHRTELYTTPDPYAPVATPWERHLTLHESRHIAQMQFATVKPFRWTKVLSGGFSEALWTFLYGGAPFHEGDAVYAETALTNAGRGRSADFLEYMRVAFGSGVKKNFFKWQYGTLNTYSPDYYRVSYIFYGGLRAYYDALNYNAIMHENINKHHGITFTFKNETTRAVSGLKFTPLFNAISTKLAKEWSDDEQKRGPYMASYKVNNIKGRFTDYHNFVSDGNYLFAVRNGIAKPYKLVRLNKDGGEKIVSGFSSYASQIRYSQYNGKMYWSEYVPNVRWGEESSSDIFYSTNAQKHYRLTRGQRYYNPYPSSLESKIAVVSYPIKGGSSVEILDAENGSVLESFAAPDGLQVVEVVWLGKELYVSGLSSEGFGIYTIKNGKYEVILAPEHLQVKQLFEHKAKLHFTSDRSGVNELYALDVDSCELQQLTSTRWGAADFCFEGDSLYYSSLEVEGRYVTATAISELKPKRVEFKSEAVFPIADKLAGIEPVQYNESAVVEISEPKKYSKLANGIKVHSWLPVYFDKDNISAISMSTLSNTVWLGATVFSQNDLNTLYGSLAYKAMPSDQAWRHAGTATVTYSGLFPIFETRLDVNHRNAINYGVKLENQNYSLASAIDTKPNINAYVRTYIPLNLSSGGKQRGIIPSLTYSFSNDRMYGASEDWRYMSRLNASFRAYSIESIPSSRKYPRLGIGSEIGYSIRPEITNILGSGWYFYLYGYLPGLTEIQGLKYSLLIQEQNKNGLFNEALTTIVPRGFDSSVNLALSDYSTSTKISLDYNIPFLEINYCLLQLVFFKNLEIEPHFDYSYLFDTQFIQGHLWSAGADLLVRIETPSSPIRIGVSFNYIGGNELFTRLQNADFIKKSFHIGLATEISF